MLTKCHAGCCDLCKTPPYVTAHQVEVNTIASGFGHMGPISGSLQWYLQDITEYLMNLCFEGFCLNLIDTQTNERSSDSRRKLQNYIVSYQLSSAVNEDDN